MKNPSDFLQFSLDLAKEAGQIQMSYFGNISSIKKKSTNIDLLTNADTESENLIISKIKKIRKIVHTFQINFAYNPPNKYNGSCLDGRDITYNIVPDADFKFYVTANLKTRAMRRYKELKVFNKKLLYKDVLKSIRGKTLSKFKKSNF